VYLKQDAVMQFIRFAQSCRIGSHVVGAEINTAAFKALARQITNAPTLEILSTFSDQVS
jgi:hypothetical protein